MKLKLDLLVVELLMGLEKFSFLRILSHTLGLFELEPIHFKPPPSLKKRDINIKEFS